MEKKAPSIAEKRARHSRIRLIIQASFAALSNGYIKGFTQGKIFEVSGSGNSAFVPP